MDVTFKQTNLSSLSETERLLYRSFILTEAQEYFNHPRVEDSYSLLAEARVDNQLVGLALATVLPDPPHAELKSIYVAEQWRKKGIGKKLFGYLQTMLGQHAGLMLLFYEIETPSGQALTRIIRSFGWHQPSPHLLRLDFDARAFDISWLENLPPLSTEFKIVPWKKRSVKDEWKIEYLGDQGRYTPSISPKNNAALIHAPTSFVLHHGDELISWCITHRLDEDTLRFGSFFSDQFYRGRGYGVYLLAQSFRAIKELGFKRVTFDINLRELERSWGSFVKKRLVPRASSLRKFYLITHTLEAGHK